MCNLSSVNGGAVESLEDFKESAKAAAILGTLQAGYTDFVYLDKASQDITEREALIGVSITGWMNNPEILFQEETMKQGATLVRETNMEVAKMIGINPAARCTTTKPEGNTSVLLGCASGIHGEHSPLYFRNVQMNIDDETLNLIREINPKMVEKSVWSNNGNDCVVSFPIKSPSGSVYKSDLLGVKQLEYVKKAQNCWVEYGTNPDLCVDPTLRHNISNTITVDDWDEVEDYIYENRSNFAGISLLSAMGDKAYAQAPFTEVFTAEQIYSQYGDASMFASGLIVDGLKAFNGNLWAACDTVNGWGEKLDEESSDDLLKRDWVRRANNYAKNYFKGDVLEMTNCLKDCHNFHKWKTIERTIKGIEFANELGEKRFTEVDTMAGAACAGGACDINF